MSFLVSRQHSKQTEKGAFVSTAFHKKKMTNKDYLSIWKEHIDEFLNKVDIPDDTPANGTPRIDMVGPTLSIWGNREVVDYVYDSVAMVSKNSLFQKKIGCKLSKDKEKVYKERLIANKFKNGLETNGHIRIYCVDVTRILSAQCVSPKAAMKLLEVDIHSDILCLMHGRYRDNYQVNFYGMLVITRMLSHNRCITNSKLVTEDVAFSLSTSADLYKTKKDLTLTYLRAMKYIGRHRPDIITEHGGTKNTIKAIAYKYYHTIDKRPGQCRVRGQVLKAVQEIECLISKSKKKDAKQATGTHFDSGTPPHNTETNDESDSEFDSMVDSDDDDESN